MNCLLMPPEAYFTSSSASSSCLLTFIKPLVATQHEYVNQCAFIESPLLIYSASLALAGSLEEGAHGAYAGPPYPVRWDPWEHHACETKNTMLSFREHHWGGTMGQEALSYGICLFGKYGDAFRKNSHNEFQGPKGGAHVLMSDWHDWGMINGWLMHVMLNASLRCG